MEVQCRECETKRVFFLSFLSLKKNPSVRLVVITFMSKPRVLPFTWAQIDTHHPPKHHYRPITLALTWQHHMIYVIHLR